MFTIGVLGSSAYRGADNFCVSKKSWLSFLRTEKWADGTLVVIANTFGWLVIILLFMSLAIFWYTGLKINPGSNTWLRRLNMCCLWKRPESRNLENSSGFLIVMSTAPLDLDLNEIGFPLTDISWDDLFVINPRSEKSSLDFALNESSPSFRCWLILVL